MTDTPSVPLVGITSHQGIRGEENDDHAAWFAVARPDRRHMVYVGVVADGVTSTTGGAQASRIAVEAIEAALRDLPDPQETITEWLVTAIHSANDEILFAGKRHLEWQG
ncbi:MAG: protein phosphatase 2C domain-containing protein [Caldilineaceae bacterium]